MPQYREDGRPLYTTGHHAVTFAATLRNADGKRVALWERGATYVGIPAGTAIDGDRAHEMVTFWLTLRPGDTDDDFFADYTEAQRDFAERFGGELNLLREERWGAG